MCLFTTSLIITKNVTQKLLETYLRRGMGKGWNFPTFSRFVFSQNNVHQSGSALCFNGGSITWALLIKLWPFVVEFVSSPSPFQGNEVTETKNLLTWLVHLGANSSPLPKLRKFQDIGSYELVIMDKDKICKREKNF